MRKLVLLFAFFVSAAQADAVDALRDFTRDVKSGRTTFTQVVSSTDNAKKKTSSGSFEFARPNRFRFAYAKPYEQVIVGDGESDELAAASVGCRFHRVCGPGALAGVAALLENAHA